MKKGSCSWWVYVVLKLQVEQIFHFNKKEKTEENKQKFQLNRESIANFYFCL